MQRTTLSHQTVQKYLDLGLRIVDSSNRLIIDAMRQGFVVEDKSDGSLVSATDKAVEKLVRRMIAEEMPEAGVLGEEFGHSNPKAELQWVVDPIDGTTDFVRGVPLFGTVLSLFINQEPLVGILDFPALGERYWAGYRLGMKTSGGRAPDPSIANSDKVVIAISAPQSLVRSELDIAPLSLLAKRYPDSRTYWTCYSQAITAAGKLNASVELNLRLWDVGAAQMLAEEAGQSFRWLHAPTPWPHGTCAMVMGELRIVDDICDLLREYKTVKE